MYLSINAIKSCDEIKFMRNIWAVYLALLCSGCVQNIAGNTMTNKVVCRDIAGKTYEVETGQLVFRPSVYAVIMRDNKVLLSKNWDGYDFPGGGIELAETVEAALKREVKEEAGLEVTVGSIITCGDSFFKMPYSGKFVHAIAMYYFCEVVGGVLSKEFFDEHEKEYGDMPEWIDLAVIKNTKFYSALDAKMVLTKACDMLASKQEDIYFSALADTRDAEKVPRVSHEDAWK